MLHSTLRLCICMAMHISSDEVSSGQDSPGVAALPPLVYAAGLLAGFGLDALLPAPSISGPAGLALGGVLVAAGMVLAAAFFRAFHSAGTPVDVRKPTAALVTSGPFRLSRNPGYVSLALIYAGIAIVGDAPWAFAMLVPTLLVVDRGVIQREERYLERKFGEPYLRYRAQTRRWL